MQQGGCVYIMTDRPQGTLYGGVTYNLPAPVARHRREEDSAFCRRYDLTRLAHGERHATILGAITREKAMKAWQPAWKITLIEAADPESHDPWDDLHLAS